MELLIVVVLIGIIAGFALPNYEKSIRKAHERDAVLQLTSLHAASLIYKAQTGTYWDTAGVDKGLTDINTEFGINIVANEMTYLYTSSDGKKYIATAAWDENDPDKSFEIRVTHNPIAPGSNPCCLTTGQCPSLPDCT